MTRAALAFVVALSWASPGLSAALPTELEVVADPTAILLAPVTDSPAAGQVAAGTPLGADAAVFGEAIDGSPDWYLVMTMDEPRLRGFVHWSWVREQP